MRRRKLLKDQDRQKLFSVPTDENTISSALPFSFA